MGLALVGVGLAMIVVVVAVFAAAGALARAQTGADLGALSAALALQRGSEACPAGERAASGAGAEVRGCVIDGEDVIVEATAPIGGGVAGQLASAVVGDVVRAEARAGPVR